MAFHSPTKATLHRSQCKQLCRAAVTLVDIGDDVKHEVADKAIKVSRTLEKARVLVN